MADSNYDLKDQLRLSVTSHLEKLEVTVIRNYPFEIDKVVQVYLKESIDIIKPHELFSGKRLSMRIDGSASVFEKIENGSRSRNIEFWINDVQFRFIAEKESFEILELNEFLIVDFNN